MSGKSILTIYQKEMLELTRDRFRAGPGGAERKQLMNLAPR